jgi:hypothetical protein
MPSTSRLFAAFAATLFAAMASSPVRAQHGGAGGASLSVAPREASQFDFLVGQWELVVRPKPTSLAQRIHGPRELAGSWRAWRGLDGWGIEDELRITDRSGNPIAFTHHVRLFDARATRWNITTFEPAKGATSSATATARDGAVVVNASGVDGDGKRYVSRATFSKITPASFAYRLDRSYDGGTTWEEGITKIEAKRVAASRP